MKTYFIFSKDLNDGCYTIEGWYDINFDIFSNIIFGISKHDGSEENLNNYSWFLDKYKNDIISNFDL
jgi:hypothetical protein